MSMKTDRRRLGTLAQIAEAVLRSNFKGQVVCGHCCSLAVLTDEQAKRTIALAREANLNIVSLPLVNQYLQGRLPGMTPRWRGVTQLRELKSAGVACHWQATIAVTRIIRSAILICWRSSQAVSRLAISMSR